MLTVNRFLPLPSSAPWSELPGSGLPTKALLTSLAWLPRQFECVSPSTFGRCVSGLLALADFPTLFAHSQSTRLATLSSIATMPALSSGSRATSTPSPPTLPRRPRHLPPPPPLCLLLPRQHPHRKTLRPTRSRPGRRSTSDCVASRGGNTRTVSGFVRPVSLCRLSPPSRCPQAGCLYIQNN